LAAHVRDELGINEISQAKPIQAAMASGAAFTIGGALPFLVTLSSFVDLDDIDLAKSNPLVLDFIEKPLNKAKFVKLFG
jgi:hypothetical protein